MGQSRRLIGLAIVALVFLAAIAAAAYPFYVQTGVGAVTSSTCLPVLQAWKSAPPTPSAADMAVFTKGGLPTPAQVHDPAYRATIAANVKSPAYLRVTRWLDWTTGQGACVPRSRGRMHLSEGLIFAGGLLALGLLLVDRRSRRTALA